MADQRSDHSLRMREIARLLRESEGKSGDDWDQEITAVTEVPPVVRAKTDSTVDPEELNTVSKNVVGMGSCWRVRCRRSAGCRWRLDRAVS